MTYMLMQDTVVDVYHVQSKRGDGKATYGAQPDLQVRGHYRFDTHEDRQAGGDTKTSQSRLTFEGDVDIRPTDKLVAVPDGTVYPIIRVLKPLLEGKVHHTRVEVA